MILIVSPSINRILWAEYTTRPNTESDIRMDMIKNDCVARYSVYCMYKNSRPTLYIKLHCTFVHLVQFCCNPKTSGNTFFMIVLVFF